MAPVTVPSLGSSCVMVRVSGSSPARRRPTRLDWGVTRQRWLASSCTASGVNQSVRGPGTTSSTTSRSVPGRSSGGSCALPTMEPSATGRSASRSLAARAGGPTWARVSVDRLPSTGATSKPPRAAT